MSSAKPYIGCKIGLISKAQNRYEGILYTIDKANSTVVLAKGEWSGARVQPGKETCASVLFCLLSFYRLKKTAALLHRGCP